MAAFVPIAKQETVMRHEIIKVNNAHNLTNVKRTKSEMGIFSDYPHYYDLAMEGSNQTVLYAMRSSENGEFVISN